MNRPNNKSDNNKSDWPEGLGGHPNLSFITFTGVDDQTSIWEIYALHALYQRVEFGFLVGSHSGQDGYNRYPEIDKLKQNIKSFQETDLPTAIHLCGQYSRSLMRGDLEPIWELCDGFNRVQINAQPADYDFRQIVTFAEGFSGTSVILQQREAFIDRPPLVHPKVEYLFDCSGGRGLANLNDWPSPTRHQARSGYAGGLNPNNINQALEFVNLHPDSQIWLDIESGIRDESNWLDTNLINQICRTAYSQS